VVSDKDLLLRDYVDRMEEEAAKLVKNNASVERSDSSELGLERCHVDDSQRGSSRRTKKVT
jgi:hypothetical protein